MPMDELPASLAALVGQARSAHDPSADDARRVGEALSVRIPGFATTPQSAQAVNGGESATSSLGPSTLVRRASTGSWVISLVAAAVAAFGGVLVMHQLSHQTAAPRKLVPAPHVAIEPTAGDRTPASTAFKPPPTPTPPVGATPPTAAAPLVAPAKRARSTSRPPLASNADSVEKPKLQLSAADASQELALIRQASQALRDRQPVQALQLLQRHTTRFPAGILTQERIGLTVIALCEQGRLVEARALRQQFLVAAPDSPLAGRVRHACAGSANDPRAP